MKNNKVVLLIPMYSCDIGQVLKSDRQDYCTQAQRAPNENKETSNKFLLRLIRVLNGRYGENWKGRWRAILRVKPTRWFSGS